MMYDVKIDKMAIQNHFQYDWWKYLVIVLATIIIWNGVTNYKINKAIPEDERMEICLVGDFIYNDTTEQISERIIEEVGGLQKLDIINIPMLPLEEQKKRMQGYNLEPQEDKENSEDGNQNQIAIDPQLDLAGQQKLMVMIGSQSGDIYMFESDRYKLYAEQGAFMALDEYEEYIKELIGDEYADKLEELKVKSEDDDEPHLYGIPADSIKVFEDTGYNTEDKVLCIMAYSKKPEKAWNVAKWLLTADK